MRYISADEQKKDFVANLLSLLGHGKEPVILQQDGKNVAVLLPSEEFALYEAFKKQQVQAFLRACDEMAAEAAANGLTEEKLAEILNG